eukprot:TRINITY_DN21883_c0_g1_i1.p3 TRINITY_DN21883_c0_g1~~TRINITY_DN21883_c0_g1_i1.p3  ORF type:complete len:146 (+),score=25.22 TRINITY_DN21883_c0_g1_i1:43-438(+)
MWREAVLYVQPDGTVHLSTWGNTKEIRRSSATGDVNAQGLSRLEPIFSAALKAKQEEGRAAKPATKNKGAAAQPPKQPKRPKQPKGTGDSAAKRDRPIQDKPLTGDDPAAKDALRNAKRKPGSDPEPDDGN